MRKATLTIVALLITAGLSACNDDDNVSAPTPGTVDGGDTGSVTEPQDDFTDDELALIDSIKQNSLEHGIPYRFDQMDPVIEDLGDDIKIYFVYKSENITGGSPEVLMNKESGEIYYFRNTQ